MSLPSRFFWKIYPKKKKPRILSAAEGKGRTSEVNVIRLNYLRVGKQGGIQIVEIALRNAIHDSLHVREGADNWYDCITDLADRQNRQIKEARTNLQREQKTVTPGRMVAEFHFGFWTSFFNKCHAGSGIGHFLASQVFSCAPRTERNMKNLDKRLTLIRGLRNRVFHHERIIHWKDLDVQHVAILNLIEWINPELCEMARALDRYTPVRSAGIEPWLGKLRQNRPDPATPVPYVPWATPRF